MNRQYIGARYVPKFYTNSLGGNDWQQGVAYEALTVVTYNGNSYTSKVPVPASVGNPSANPEYWVATGIYSAQVEVLRQQVEGVLADVETNTDDIDNLKEGYYNFKHRKVLFIGDSYAEGWTPDGTYTGWPELVGNKIDCEDWEQVYVGGIGFSSTIGGVNFGNAANNVEDKDSFTDIVICGGRNDAGASYSTLITAIDAAITNYKGLFRNAVIHIGMIAYTEETGVQVDLYALYKAYLYGAVRRGAHYLYGVETAIHNADSMASDKKHPNQTGQTQIANGIAAALKYDYYTEVSKDTGVMETGWTGYIETKRVGHNLKLLWNTSDGTDLNTPFDSSVADCSFKLATINSGLRFYQNWAYFQASAMVGYKDGSNNDVYEIVPVTLRLTRGDVIVQFRLVSASRNAWASGTIDYIHIFAGSGMTELFD